MTRALALAAFVSCWLVTPAFAADARIGVFGLFHPRALVVRSADDGGMTLRTDRDACVLRGREVAELRVSKGSVQAVCGGRVLTTPVLRITSRIGGVADIELTVPDRISRKFRGLMDVAVAGGELVPVVAMDLETAVASVVAAEQLDGTPTEALKAQAVAARSYFVAATGRHRGFEFCDTTHCQFLREPPGPDHAAFRAARDTNGLVLTFHGAPIVALYSASCGGRTRSLADAKLPATDGYPYFSVECSFCARHGREWESRLAVDPDAERLVAERSESARLAVGRRNGWSAVPGHNFEMSRDGDTLILFGRGHGHGVGLCQLGAAGSARERHATFSEILSQYYPGTTLGAWPSPRGQSRLVAEDRSARP